MSLSANGNSGRGTDSRGNCAERLKGVDSGQWSRPRYQQFGQPVLFRCRGLIQRSHRQPVRCHMTLMQAGDLPRDAGAVPLVPICSRTIDPLSARHSGVGGTESWGYKNGQPACSLPVGARSAPLAGTAPPEFRNGNCLSGIGFLAHGTTDLLRFAGGCAARRIQSNLFVKQMLELAFAYSRVLS